MRNKNISIVSTAYRSEKYLKNFFRYITNFKNFDEVFCILILNDPSELERSICDIYQEKFPNHFNCIILKQRETIAQSLNRGFCLVETPFVTYIDVDDQRTPNSLLDQKETLLKNEAVDYTYGNLIEVKNQGLIKGKKINVIEFERNEFTRGCYVNAVHFFRKSVFEKIGYWDEQFKSGGDFEFQARAAAAGVLFKKTNATLLYYTKEENSKSASSNILQPIERTVIELRYGIFDKIDYRYYDEAMKYRIHEIKEGDKWIPVSSVIPDYEKFIEERKYLLPIGKRNHFINTLKRSIKTPLKMILKTK